MLNAVAPPVHILIRTCYGVYSRLEAKLDLCGLTAVGWISLRSASQNRVTTLTIDLKVSQAGVCDRAAVLPEKPIRGGLTRREGDRLSIEGDWETRSGSECSLGGDAPAVLTRSNRSSRPLSGLPCTCTQQVGICVWAPCTG